MIINFNQNLKKLDGTMLPRVNVKSCPSCGFRAGVEEIVAKEMTLKYVTQESLQLSFGDEQGLSGEEKAKRWLLATRIELNPESIDLTVEEIALIKKLIGKAYGPLIVGQSWNMLEKEGATAKN